MAISDPSIYSPPTDDEEIKKKRRLLASSLWEARQKGLTPEEAFSREMMAEPSEFSDSPNIKFDDLNLSPLEIGGFIDRLYAGKYDKPKSTMSTFAQEEQEARKRSAASGAFGGEGWKGKSSKGFVDTPNLDRLARMQEEPVGFRTMADSRRSIESPEGEARRLLTKAYKMGINPTTLVTSEGGVGGAVEALKEAGFGRGIRTAEETKARREMGSSQRKEERALMKSALEEIKKRNKLEEDEEDEES